MPSVLAWVDYSSTHREDMDRFLDAFRDKGTVDELGVGTMRNVFSELLFPGTSTLHTRARYLLFVPWAVTSVTSRGLPSDRALRELRQQEVRLIEALRAGDIDGGVIGRDARANLERMASVAYWGALGIYDIRRCGHTIAQHCRYASERPMASLDEDDEGHQLRHVDPCFRQLPGPPKDWLTRVDFALTREEAEFLRDRILDSRGDSYLAWLLQHGLRDGPAMPWAPALTAALPAKPARALNHARRFSLLHEGAPILYNLLLARQKAWQEGIDTYSGDLQSWSHSEETQEALSTWDRGDFWHCLAQAGWRLNPATQAYVDAWTTLVRGGSDLAHDPHAEKLIRDRELRLKGRRSRFVNTEALESWEGGNGMGRMLFRWPEAKRLVTDIRNGLELLDA